MVAVQPVVLRASEIIGGSRHGSMIERGTPRARTQITVLQNITFDFPKSNSHVY